MSWENIRLSEEGKLRWENLLVDFFGLVRLAEEKEARIWRPLQTLIGYCDFLGMIASD